jgi:hypothetical protein
VSDHALLMPFDTDDPEFARGFEAGHVWTMLQHTQEREFTIHWRNAETMLRIAEALELTVVATPLDDAWTSVVFS